MNIRRIPIRNLKKKPLRTMALLFIAASLEFAMFGGSIIVLSIQRGIDSLEARLGADIIVVPDETDTGTSYETIVLEGTPGYFYMDKTYLEQIAGMEGVEMVSPQYFLASSDSVCCSVPLQIIGFDPETDFSIQPWIQESYKKELNDYDIVIGSDVYIPVGSSTWMYNVKCNVVAKLDDTGTSLDNSVYMTANTVKLLIEAAEEESFDILEEESPDEVVSAIYVKLKDGYRADSVTNDINKNIPLVKAVKAKNMLIGISDGLSGISGTITMLIIAVWGMSLIIMLIAFSLPINERKKEFAILRMIGTSRKTLFKIILAESAVLSIVGGIVGVAISCLVILQFSTLIENKIGLPFLLPNVGQMVFLIVDSLIVSVLIGSMSSAYAAFRLSRVDVGLALREGN